MEILWSFPQYKFLQLPRGGEEGTKIKANLSSFSVKIGGTYALENAFTWASTKWTQSVEAFLYTSNKLHKMQYELIGKQLRVTYEIYYCLKSIWTYTLKKALLVDVIVF